MNRMRLFFFFLFLWSVSLGIDAGQLSPQFVRVKNEYRNSKADFLKNGQDTHLMQGVYSQGNELYATATIEAYTLTGLNTLGIQYTKITDSIVVAQVPLHLLDSLEESDTIGYIQSDYKNELHNDIATNTMGSLIAHSQSIYGEDVLVGIIDTGIDITHNAFKIDGDSAKGTRILYLWDQTKAFFTQFTVGTFTSTSGRRWTSAEINNGSCDQVDINGHGTHVAGSFAGYDAVYPTRRGTATKANLIIVKTTLYSSDILKALRYLSEQAKSIGKPIVVNMSLGSRLGPHDGTDLDTKAVDDLITASNGNFIVVRSAGNNGADGHHDSVAVSTATSSMPIVIPSYTPTTGGYPETVFTNFYYDASASVRIRITSPNMNTTGWVTPSASPETFYLNTDGRCYIQNKSTAESYNSSIKNIYFELGEVAPSDSTGAPVPGTWNIEFETVSGPTTTLHGWIYNSWRSGIAFSSPDHMYTLGNGACGKNVIVVGAYVSRHTWTSINGTYNNGSSYIQDTIAPFSSQGPTRDGRQKPDVVAPGSMILSTLPANLSSFIEGKYKAPSGNYQFMQGTSMATPLAAGAIAILKQKNPTWSYNDIITYFKSNSQGTSVYSGQNNFSNLWGWGVIDLKGALLEDFTAFDVVSHSVADTYNYTSGQDVQLSWSPAASSSYVINYSIECKHENGTWYTASTTNSTNQGSLAENWFTDGYGRYSIRIKAVDSAGNLPTSYSTNTITHVYYSSLHSPVTIHVHDGLRPTNDFLYYNNGNENFNVHWLDDTNNNTDVSYQYQFVWGTTESPKTTASSITVQQGYEGFNALNINLGSFKREPGKVCFWIVNNLNPLDRVYIEKPIFIRNVVWELLPHPTDTNKIKIIALLQNAIETDLAKQMFTLRVREGSIATYYEPLLTLSNGLYVASSDVLLQSYQQGVYFDLFYNNLTSTVADDYAVGGVAKTKTTYSIFNSPVRVHNRLSLKGSESETCIFVLSIHSKELAGIPDIKGDVLYIGNVTSALTVVPDKGYRLMNLQNSWVATSQIRQAGYYAIVPGNMPGVQKTSVKGNFPNPFNPETTIVYDVEEDGLVELEIYTAKGKVVKKVTHFATAGTNEFYWNGKDALGRSMPSGVYYFALHAQGKRYVNKMIMLK